jgi:hypothetical protein
MDVASTSSRFSDDFPAFCSKGLHKAKKENVSVSPESCDWHLGPWRLALNEVIAA